MTMRQKESSSIGPGVVLITLLICLAAFIPVLIIFGPQLLDKIKLPEPETPPEPAPSLPPEAQAYYDLKNTSCRTLSKNFLLVTDDASKGTLAGMKAASPDEYVVALRIATENDYNQTTRTYVRGDQMKKVFLSGNLTHTMIWKEGRLY